jgi:hypothetical protein
MAGVKKFEFQELDSQSREYLLDAQRCSGRGMPGLFIPRNDPLPTVALITGIVILAGTALLSWQLMTEEPLGVAMLQTAGLLLGGWLIFYALRVGLAIQNSKYPGNFVYADANTLWECESSTVMVTHLDKLNEAHAEQHFGNEGRYSHTVVTVQTADGNHSLKVHKEVYGQALADFLNTLAWLRGGGVPTTQASRFEVPGHDPGGLRNAWQRAGGNAARDSNEGNAHQKLSAPALGRMAKELVLGGHASADSSAEAPGLPFTELPIPKKVGRASSGLLSYLLIIGVAVGGVFAFAGPNVGWRDDAIWEKIEQIEEQDDRAPWLRGYLADARNTKRRDEARQMLRTIYADTISRIRAGVTQKQRFGEHLPAPAAPANDRFDKELVAGLEVVLKELAEQPLPLVSVSIKEKRANQDGARERDDALLKKYTLAVLNGVGKELVEFAVAPPGTAGMIDIVHDHRRTVVGTSVRWHYTFTISFRRSTDGDVVKTVTRDRINDSTDEFGAGLTTADYLGVRTAGQKKLELQPFEE